MTAFDRIKQLLDLFRHTGDGACHRAGKYKRQAAAIIFRDAGDAPEILLITSRDTGRWIVPKGWIEKGEDGSDAAIREAWEEAGVIGRPLSSDGPVGHFTYIKQRPRRGDAICEVDVYLLKLVDKRGEWPEQAERRRKWFPVPTAITMVAEEGLKDVIRDAFQRVKAA